MNRPEPILELVETAIELSVFCHAAIVFISFAPGGDLATVIAG